MLRWLKSKKKKFSKKTKSDKSTSTASDSKPSTSKARDDDHHDYAEIGSVTTTTDESSRHDLTQPYAVVSLLPGFRHQHSHSFGGYESTGDAKMNPFKFPGQVPGHVTSHNTSSNSSCRVCDNLKQTISDDEHSVRYCSTRHAQPHRDIHREIRERSIPRLGTSISSTVIRSRSFNERTHCLSRRQSIRKQTTRGHHSRESFRSQNEHNPVSDNSFMDKYRLNRHNEMSNRELPRIPSHVTRSESVSSGDTYYEYDIASNCSSTTYQNCVNQDQCYNKRAPTNRSFNSNTSRDSHRYANTSSMSDSTRIYENSRNRPSFPTTYAPRSARVPLTPLVDGVCSPEPHRARSTRRMSEGCVPSRPITRPLNSHMILPLTPTRVPTKVSRNMLLPDLIRYNHDRQQMFVS